MFNRILLGILMLCAAPAFGLVLEFDDVPDEGEGWESGGIFTESGFTISGMTYYRPSAIHLDDSGTGFDDRAVITGSKRFDAVSLHIFGYENSGWYDILDPSIDGPYPNVTIVYPNVLVRGIRDSAIVAETRFTANSEINYTLSSDFSRLDSLIVYVRDPSDPALASYISAFESSLELLYPGIPFEQICDNPCSHFDLDSVEVNPTPIPGALVLMLSAVLGGGITRRFLFRGRAGRLGAK